MSKHSAPPSWRVRAMLRKIIALPAALMVVIAMALSAGFMVTSATAATVTTSGDQDCTYEWVREIPQSHKEYKYAKTIPAVPAVMEYLYKRVVAIYETEYRKQTHTKVKHGDGEWGAYDAWEWWEPALFKTEPGDDNPEVIEGPAFHNKGQYTHGDHTDTWYREYRYFKTRVLDKGSKLEYSEWTTEILSPTDGWSQVGEPRVKVPAQPAQTILYKDGAWTTDKPGDEWDQIAERPVVDPPIKQGPVRSANEPARGDHPNVAWTKVPGSEECSPQPPKPEDKVTYTEWKDGDKSCESKTVTQSRSKSVITYTWNEDKHEWVASTPVITTEMQTRPMTAAELQECAGSQPANDRQTRPAEGEPNCDINTVSTWTEERTRSYVLEDGKWVPGPWSDWTKVAGSDSTRPATDEECPEPELASVVVKAFCGYVEFTNPAANVETVTVLYGSFDNESEDGSTEVAPGKTVKVPTKRTTLDFVAVGVESGTYAGTGSVKVSQECGTNPPPKPPVPPKSEEPNKPPFKPTPVKPVVTAPSVVKGPRVETDGGPSGPGSGLLLLGLGTATVLALGFGLRRRTARR